MRILSACFIALVLSFGVVRAQEAVTVHSAGPGPDPFGPVGVFTISGVANQTPLTGAQMLAFVEAEAAKAQQDGAAVPRSLLFRIFKDAKQVGQIDFTENMLLQLADKDERFTFVGFGVDPATLSMDIFLLQQGIAFDQAAERKAIDRLKIHLFRETAVAQTVQRFRVMTVLVDGSNDTLQKHVLVLEPGANGVSERVESF